LVDSVLKNVGGPYVQLFASHIAEVFRRVFDEVCISTFHHTFFDID